MLISGFIKNSLIDFPGKISSVIFTQGCNLRCKFCHNYELIPRGLQEEDVFLEVEVLQYLERSRRLIDALVITGGEPCLQPDLVQFIRKVKDMGLKVKLDTNGTDPGKLEYLLEQNLVDYVAMDVKAPLDLMAYRKLVGDQFSRNAMARVKASIELIKNSEIPYEFRTTLIRECHPQEHIRTICNQLKGARKYTLQQFAPEKVLDQSFALYSGYDCSDLEELKSQDADLIEEIHII
ncbi:MAG: anaerobic ribonucleoside-triphosphate reductase activating protein [Marinifilaceae bacterium]